MNIKSAALLHPSAAALGQNPDQVVAAAFETLKRDPHCAEAWETATRIFMEHGKWEEARGLLQSALAFVSNHPRLPIYHAMALMETGHLTEAFACTNAILQQQPDNPHALFAKGEILRHAGYYDLARGPYESAARTKSLRSTAAFGKAIVDFVTGDCVTALAELARIEEDAPDAPPLPLWNGKPDAVQHLIVYGSQGFGDIMMFLRYIDAAKPFVGKLTLRVPYQLARLVHDSCPALPLYATRDPGDMRAIALPPGISFDMPHNATARIPLIKLSLFPENGFNTHKESVPYLRADPEKIHVMRERIAHLPKPHIGLVWAGSPRHQADHARSIPFDALRPLLDAAKPHLVSLQMQPHRAAAMDAGLFDVTPFIADFADTAALISALDLLVTVDTAPAHLAGALGAPVFTLLPFTHLDWRWLLGREDTIWYASMRLFRQKTPRNWMDVIEAVTVVVQKFLAGDRDILRPTSWAGKFLSRHPQTLGLPGIPFDA